MNFNQFLLQTKAFSFVFQLQFIVNSADDFCVIRAYEKYSLTSISSRSFSYTESTNTAKIDPCGPPLMIGRLDDWSPQILQPPENQNYSWSRKKARAN